MKMTAKQFKGALEDLELPITGSGDVIGLSPRQAQRLAANDCPVPMPVAKLVHLMHSGVVSVDQVRNAGLTKRQAKR
jgi:hypothetical protein